MLRHREVKGLLVYFALVMGGGVLCVMFLQVPAFLLVLIPSILIVGGFFVFTNRRYKDIERLSEYVRSIAAGSESLDIRDNAEGELSILKNDIYRVTRMLSEQSADLEGEKNKLSDAISDISHQLKTPLTSMTVMADLLHEPKVNDDKRREFARHQLVQLERMEWLVTSLLKLSKMDAGGIVFKNEEVLVEELIERSLHPLLIPIELKEIHVDIKGNPDVQYVGDLHWSMEAVGNVLKNAVEHTQPGGKLTITYTSNILFTEIQIADSGSGIPKQELPYIFQRFYKGTHAKEGSVGIGLALVQQMIKSQNGEVDVQSKEGEGTVFRITFYKQSRK
ncbi:sensor histidine kinase [Alkalihalobacillus sp. NPDC078783]